MLKYHGASHEAHFLGPGCGREGGQRQSNDPGDSKGEGQSESDAVSRPCEHLSASGGISSSEGLVGSPLRQREIPPSPGLPYYPCVARRPALASQSGLLASVPVDRGKTSQPAHVK